MSPADVGKVQARAGLLAGLLAGHHEAVARHVLEWVADLSDDDLEAVVDRRWDPPVTLGTRLVSTRLVSVLLNAARHSGQAAYLRGLATRAGVGASARAGTFRRFRRPLPLCESSGNRSSSPRDNCRQRPSGPAVVRSTERRSEESVLRAAFVAAVIATGAGVAMLLGLDPALRWFLAQLHVAGHALSPAMVREVSAAFGVAVFLWLWWGSRRTVVRHRRPSQTRPIR